MFCKISFLIWNSSNTFDLYSMVGNFAWCLASYNFVTTLAMACNCKLQFLLYEFKFFVSFVCFQFHCMSLASIHDNSSYIICNNWCILLLFLYIPIWLWYHLKFQIGEVKRVPELCMRLRNWSCSKIMHTFYLFELVRRETTYYCYLGCLISFYSSLWITFSRSVMQEIF